MGLAVLGGFRDETVGTDIETYGISYFENAKNASSLFSLLSEKFGEYGYHTLMWICANISDDIHFMFFVSELIKIWLVASTAIFFRKEINTTIFIFTYLTFFYFTGFNIMRQALALSIYIYGLRYLYLQQHLKFILTCCIAMLFHSSAFIAFLIYPINIISAWGKKAILIQLAIITCIYLGALQIMNYIQTLNFGIYSSKALLYLNRDGAETAKSNILIAFFLLLISYIYKFKNHLNYRFCKNYIVYLSLLLYNLLLLFISTQFEVAFRLSWYQIPILILIYLNSAKQYPHYKSKILYIMLIILFFLHFTIEAMHGLGDTIPYTSRILGI